MQFSIKQSDAEALAAFGATTSQYLAAILGCHTGTETVDTFALQVAGLESAFHWNNLVVSCSRPRIVGSWWVAVNVNRTDANLAF